MISLPQVIGEGVTGRFKFVDDKLLLFLFFKGGKCCCFDTSYQRTTCRKVLESSDNLRATLFCNQDTSFRKIITEKRPLQTQIRDNKHAVIVYGKREEFRAFVCCISYIIAIIKPGGGSWIP